MHSARSVAALQSGLLACLAVSGCAPPITISPAALPAGVQGSLYSQTLTSDAQAAVTWTVISGTLPASLTLDASTGTLSGVPSESGTFAFTVQASAGLPIPASGQQDYSLTIIAKLTLDATLDHARVDIAYSDTLTVAGGVSPYSFSVIGLPAGLGLDTTTGTMSGTPLNAQTVQLQATVTDSGSPQQSVTQTTFLLVKAPAVTIATTTLPDGEVNEDYSQQVEVADGMLPLAWQVGPDVGTLPLGLRLDTDDGTISGTPTTAGTYAFTITVTDADDPPTTDARRFTIVIQP